MLITREAYPTQRHYLQKMKGYLRFVATHHGDDRSVTGVKHERFRGLVHRAFDRRRHMVLPAKLRASARATGKE